MRHIRATITARTTACCMGLFMCAGMISAATLQWTDAQLLDHIKGGWLAKCAGGALGGPAEGAGEDTTRGLPALNEGDITNCTNDDVYTQVPFVATMAAKKNGADGIYSATMQDYGNALKNTTFPLWFGNQNARDALNNGIATPYCGGWPLNGVVKNGNAEAIDWQIECQWIGFVTPGLPAAAIKIDSICGHVIAYANGVYAGTFFNAAVSIAPLYNDIHPIIKEANKAIPSMCDIHINTDTLIWYHDNNPTSSYVDAYNWAFGLNGQTKHIKTDFVVGSRNNAAIVVIAALWCDNSITKAVLWAARMGSDTDCNCGDVCAIFGSMLGYANLPQQWRTTYESAQAHGINCSFDGTGASLTGWTFFRVLDSTVAISKKAILQSGGTYANGVYTIPVQDIPAPQWFEKAGQLPVPMPNAVRYSVRHVRPDGLTLALVADAGNRLRVEFSVPQVAAGRALRIDLMDLRGARVQTLVEGAFGAGFHTVTPAAQDIADARSLSTGHYLARIRSGESEQTIAAPVVR